MSGTQPCTRTRGEFTLYLALTSTAALLLLVLTSLQAGDDGTYTPKLSGNISGSITYRERIALPPDAVVEVVLLDVSLMDVAAKKLAGQTIQPTQSVPIPFALSYDPDSIQAGRSYAVRATIRRDANLLFVTDRHYGVLTRGHTEQVDLVLVRSGGGSSPVADASLTNTRWLLRSLGSERLQTAAGQRPPFLQFVPADEGNRVHGYSGCNQFNGGYSQGHGRLGFGNLAVTGMACPEMELEARFLHMLQAVSSFDIQAGWLILSDPGGELATFEAWYE